MKVSIYVQDEVWAKFRKGVLRRTGDPRALSSEVQALIQESLIEDAVVAGFDRLKISPRPLSSMRVEAVKPSSPTSAGEALREMRESRHEKALSRQ